MATIAVLFPDDTEHVTVVTAGNLILDKLDTQVH